MSACTDHGHLWHRVQLNDRDDVTLCRRPDCQQWQQVHHDVRRKR